MSSGRWAVVFAVLFGACVGNTGGDESPGLPDAASEGGTPAIPDQDSAARSDGPTSGVGRSEAGFGDVRVVSGPDASADGGCAGTLCGTVCRYLASDVANCGACGKTCAAGQVCQNGTCGCAVATCSGTCVDTTSDAKNCGACGTACAAGMVCSLSKCATGCAGTLTKCGSSCVDTSGSSQNCGTCGNTCPTDQSCWMGACRCPTGQGPCGTGNLCVDIMSNVQHCGTCANACVTGQSCASGQCACPAGQIVCAGKCIDPNTDPTNCGTCATTCTTGTQCLYGGCINPSSVNCGGGSMVGYSCVVNDMVNAGTVTSVPLGKYWVNNNQWGVSKSGTNGQQCIWGTCQTGDLVGWGTSWNWTTGSGGVKTFASLVFGWQWGFKVTNTGLPVQISANKTVNCGWDFTVSQTGTIDVSYDTWLHSISNPGTNDTPTEEVMIWLDAEGGAGPIGARVAAGVKLAGATWDLHQGQGGSTWPVSSYVRTSSAATSVMNMMEFYNDLVSRGWIPNTRYLSSIQAGTEVFTGTGSLTTNGLYCRVQ